MARVIESGVTIELTSKEIINLLKILKLQLSIGADTELDSTAVDITNALEDR